VIVILFEGMSIAVVERCSSQIGKETMDDGFDANHRVSSAIFGKQISAAHLAQEWGQVYRPAYLHARRINVAPDGQSGGQVNLYYHLEDFENAFAVLSEEKTVYLLYSGSGPGFENGIQTSADPLGNVT
jgi:hypothetical protein